jgi:hypothetical protein
VIETVKEIKKWDIDVVAGNVATREGCAGFDRRRRRRREGRHRAGIDLHDARDQRRGRAADHGDLRSRPSAEPERHADHCRRRNSLLGRHHQSHRRRRALRDDRRLFAGLAESPGKTILYQGRTFKAYRGMGSLGAMVKGSSERYRQAGERGGTGKLVPEGVEGRVPFKGRSPTSSISLSAACGPAWDIAEPEPSTNCGRNAVHPSLAASVRESHPHDIAITQEAPNYSPEMSPVRRAAPMLTASQPGNVRQPATLGFPPVGAPSGQQSTLPCDRVYNDRNCCDLEANCLDFRSRLLADSIRSISLDITPRYNPDLPLEEDEQDRLDRLRLLETRPWRNRRGAVIATGRMLKVQNSAVILGDEEGRETGRLLLGELGEDEICYVTAWWRLPAECPLGGLRDMERHWLATSYQYHASALCHKPLYFEQVQLERYGHTAGPFRQPIISGAHFIISLAGLPYQMAINPPMECEYSLGYYRPGNCAPWMIPPIPLSLRGASAEVAAALGMAYLIP